MCQDTYFCQFIKKKGTGPSEGVLFPFTISLIIKMHYSASSVGASSLKVIFLTVLKPLVAIAR